MVPVAHITHLETGANTTHLGTIVSTSHLETYAAVTHLGTSATVLISPQIVLQRLNTHSIKIITSEMAVGILYSKEQKLHLQNQKFRTTTSLKGCAVLKTHT